ncbi:MAG: hypothetical protein GX594_05575, partial [Pirellulaceae bacterium]|nr:hypothetical protein [Pirellulaceae bacterium]
DVDAATLNLNFADVPIKELDKIDYFWQDLILQSDPDTARRLKQDPAIRRDERKLTIFMDAEGTLGFSVTVDQLFEQKAMWIPSLDVYLAVGDSPAPFEEYWKTIEPLADSRILDRVAAEPEAVYADFTARWADVGGPAYVPPGEVLPGHVIGLSWDSSIHKFGVHRAAGVWNDLANPDRFRLEFDFDRYDPELPKVWRGQSLHDGLPVVTTVFERDGVRYEFEQFAYPLDGPPAERRGDVPVTLMLKATLKNLASRPKTFELRMRHRRAFDAADRFDLDAAKAADALWIERNDNRGVLLAVQGRDAAGGIFERQAEKPSRDRPIPETKELPWAAGVVRVPIVLQPGETREVIIKLPSPVVAEKDRAKLLALDYATARKATIEFWSDYLARGARFDVPEKKVNELFRANLWHALRLPRRHGGQGKDVKIDLPYSNFWYEQLGTPWPVNQAVYVDYMLFNLRGYHDVSLEELLAIYRNTQQADGRVGGMATWGSYTPAMLYASAKYYLLSDDRAGMEQLLPPTIKALDWCLGEIRRTSSASGLQKGLFVARLNDCTGQGVWAFNQAYLYAGLETLGRALQRYGHPRAQECLDAAREFRGVVERAFAAATVQSPLVQLRDHTWTPYVPCEALTPRRIVEQWYPTDVDTGAVHLPRLGALPAAGRLANALLHDHEDNLFYKGWGMANEPVYNQQATAYLRRDEPKAVVRAFYSMMACAFSHTALEPIEHRWKWGHVFGPPSTDGAWFELYRNMLVREGENDSLILFQAPPRKWLADGCRISVERAPTEYGPLSATLDSRAAKDEISAEIETKFPPNREPKNLFVRFRHPDGKPIRSATVNGAAWPSIDREKEWIAIPNPAAGRYSIVVTY